MGQVRDTVSHAHKLQETSLFEVDGFWHLTVFCFQWKDVKETNMMIHR